MLRSLAKSALLFYTTRLPYHRGKWRVVEKVISASGLEKSDAGQTFDVTRSGIRFSLGTECAMQRRLYYHAALDPHDERELFSRLPAGDKDAVFLDIGSYFGYYGLRAASLGARAHAFEPLSANFALLDKHRAMNPNLPLSVHKVALSDTIGTTTFSIPAAGNRGTGRIDAPADGGAVDTVQTTTLDAFFAEQKLTRLDAVKLDVEGAEWKVFTGGEQTFRKYRPVMLMEYNPVPLGRFGVDPAALLERLRSWGYRFFRATAHGLTPFTGLVAGEDYCNLICLPEGRN